MQENELINDVRKINEISDFERAITEGELEINSGTDLLDAKEALASLRRKHLGQIFH